MFKFFKNKRYYYRTWTGNVINSEILLRGKIHKVEIHPYLIKKRNGWLDVESKWVEYFIQTPLRDEGYFIQGYSYTDALMKLTRHLDGAGEYVY
ncbi:hypothetical protein [Bacillus phage Megatron]|uniref:Uncharacterized protein n=1 Tax=Bacillus phage Megatron TaxID=1486661 RepID=A0A024B405_9CAUD|nr:hypothetical protein FP75_gp196 [Bacillus phage Megatron]AHZ10778.1 hypothetical protein [Bacillus phage Megatron]